MRRLSRLLFVAAVAMVTAVAAHADVEKFALMGNNGMRMVWWPKIAPPIGWAQDRRSSEHYAMNAFAPGGSTFNDADTVFYARAEYKQRVPEIKTLKQYIERDRKGALSHVADLKIKPGAALANGDGAKLDTLVFEPGATAGNWERVAFLEEGDYFFNFVISARTKAGYEKNVKVYEDWIRAYKRNP